MTRLPDELCERIGRVLEDDLRRWHDEHDDEHDEREIDE